VYAVAGSYTPQVLLKDEAGNTSQVGAQGVQVVADTVKPVAKVTLPKKAVRDEVSSWKRVAGTATDVHGTGVAGASLVAIEKRGSAWWFYKAASKTWVKAATKAKAWKRATAVAAAVNSKGVWVARLVALKKGTLIVKATATDKAGNVSLPAKAKAVLTAS
jgi:hypothetical protein